MFTVAVFLRVFGGMHITKSLEIIIVDINPLSQDSVSSVVHQGFLAFLKSRIMARGEGDMNGNRTKTFERTEKQVRHKRS